MKAIGFLLAMSTALAKPMTAKEALKLSNSYNEKREVSLRKCLERVEAEANIGNKQFRYFPGPCGDSYIAEHCGEARPRLEKLGYKIQKSSVDPSMCEMCCTHTIISWDNP